MALLIRVLNNRPADDILNADLRFLDRIQMKEHLSPTRKEWPRCNDQADSVICCWFHSIKGAFMSEINPHRVSPEILRKLVIEAIKTVYDPEIPINVYDLGVDIRS